jgi:hypothetical protein
MRPIARQVAIGLLATLPVLAQEPNQNLQFSAFGTLGVARTTTNAVGYRRDDSQPMGVFEKPSWAVDTRFGAQLSAKFTEDLLGTFQVVSKYRYDGTFKPEINWACLNWKPGLELEIQAGILSVDILPNRDLSDIGYTYLWVRPPREVFGNFNPSRSVGVQVNKFLKVGSDLSLQLAASVGRTRGTVPADHVGDWNLSGGPTWGAAAELRGANWSARALYSAGKVPVNLPEPVPTLQAALASFGALLGDPKPALVADALTLKDHHFHIVQVGGVWEQGPHQLQGTIYNYNSDSTILLPSLWSGFVSYGYRMGPVVPYGMFARAVSRRAPRADLGSLPYLPAPYDAPAQALISAVDQLTFARGVDQYTYSAGLRWDFAAKTDLKFQIDRIQTHNAVGNVFNPDPTRPLTWDGRMTVFSVTLDFILGGGR